ncbi:MAG: hypothetical protein K6E75_03740 [Lachnospiraceae bacterium]|nr:hypothetical protein [Lachnospiraceae bacterium]
MKKRLLCILLTGALSVAGLMTAFAEETADPASVSENEIAAAEEDLSAEATTAAFYPAKDLPKKFAAGKREELEFSATPGAKYNIKIVRKSNQEKIYSVNGSAPESSGGSSMAKVKVILDFAGASYTYDTYTLKYWVGDDTAEAEKEAQDWDFSIAPSINSTENSNIVKAVIDPASVVYTGSDLTPKVTIKEKNTGKTLVQGTDFTVAITSENKKEIGKATLLVTGAGSYTGSEELYFEIKPTTPVLPTLSIVNTSAIKLSWNRVANAAGYRIEKKNEDGKFELLVEINDKGTIVYTDTQGLQLGKTYTYRILSFAPDAGNAAVKIYSNANETGSSIVLTTAAPKIKSYTTINTKKVKLVWDKVDGAKGYNLYTQKANGKLKVVKKNITKTNYTATKLKCGTTYKFVLKAYTTGVDGKKVLSPASAVYKVKAVPATPKLVAAEPVSGKQIKISWRLVPDASGYYIYRRGTGDEDDGYEKIKKVTGKNTLYYIDTKCEPGAKYVYTVAAYKKVKSKAVKGAYNAKGVKGQAVCAGPAIAAEQRHSNIANVYIENVEGADGFILYRKVGGGSYGDPIATFGKMDGNITTFRDTTVKDGNTYTYCAIAYTEVDGKKIKGLVGKEATLVMKAPATTTTTTKKTN